MRPIRLYTTSYCPYCMRAKQMLESKGLAFEEIDLTDDQTTRDKLQKQTGWMTVPMIFIGDEFIGGCDDLYTLDDSGELDKKLQSR